MHIVQVNMKKISPQMAYYTLKTDGVVFYTIFSRLEAIIYTSSNKYLLYFYYYNPFSKRTITNNFRKCKTDFIQPLKSIDSNWNKRLKLQITGFNRLFCIMFKKTFSFSLSESRHIIMNRL